jgi:hypothetical protein
MSPTQPLPPQLAATVYGREREMAPIGVRQVAEQADQLDQPPH